MKLALFVAIGFVGLAGCSGEGESAVADFTTSQTSDGGLALSTSYVLDHTADRITGENESLKDYQGKVVMVVNVASKCGFTNQYEQLEALYREHKDDGFVVLGFPANNFGQQEPGTNEEVMEFCSTTYGVSFPMFAKIDVIGENAHPFYKDLAGQPEPIGGDPEWNFTKFLVNRDGEVVYRFDTRTSPDDEKIVGAIRELL
ncbi:MAG: glutathione peroxidase [Phycisphaera sp.]|nr:MAG: glutathione peroxidase [Phycisphaera sp.]